MKALVLAFLFACSAKMTPVAETAIALPAHPAP
jgi:hypothetical protein